MWDLLCIKPSVVVDYDEPEAVTDAVTYTPVVPFAPPKKGGGTQTPLTRSVFVPFPSRNKGNGAGEVSSTRVVPLLSRIADDDTESLSELLPEPRWNVTFPPTSAHVAQFPRRSQ